MDDGTLLLGEREISVVAAMAATLRVVREAACRAAGAAPTSVALTYPASWGAVRRAVLLDAAVRAGLPAPTPVPEPRTSREERDEPLLAAHAVTS